MPADSTERVRLSVAEARALAESAMRGIGYDPEEARILADHVIDAALCGYEYSGLPKLLNVADHPRFKAPRSPMRTLTETSVSVLLDGGNQSGMLGMYYATRAAIERAQLAWHSARRRQQHLDERPQRLLRRDGGAGRPDRHPHRGRAPHGRTARRRQGGPRHESDRLRLPDWKATRS
jgi:hypothetical protein